MKTAIIIGATGLTGGFVLKKLLEDDQYSTIKLFSRRPVSFKNKKIKEYITDLFDLEKHERDFNADEVYCCIGSTKTKTPDQEIYRRIDYGIPRMAGELCRKNGIKKFLVISALGANPQSKIFYNRIKGEMEREVLKIFQDTFIFKPSLIRGERREKRIFESVGKKIMNIADYILIGSLKKFRSIHAEEIADAMIYVASNGYSKSRISSDEIRQIARTSKNNNYA